MSQTTIPADGEQLILCNQNFNTALTLHSVHLQNFVTRFSMLILFSMVLFGNSSYLYTFGQLQKQAQV